MVLSVYAKPWEGIVKHVVSPDTGLSKEHCPLFNMWPCITCHYGKIALETFYDVSLFIYVVLGRSAYKESYENSNNYTGMRCIDQLIY